MNRLFFATLCLVLTIGIAQAQTTKKPANSTKATTAVQAKQKHPGTHMTFDNEHLDIGKVKRGEKKKFDYVLTNTGTDVIEIDIVSGCDCTTVDYPTHKILPGQKATIKVEFDSTKKEESETVDVDVYLKNKNPKTGQRILKILDYKFELIK